MNIFTQYIPCFARTAVLRKVGIRRNEYTRVRVFLKTTHGFLWGSWLNNVKGRSFLDGQTWAEFCTCYDLKPGIKMFLDLDSTEMGDHGRGMNIPVTLPPEVLPLVHPG